MLIKFNKGVIMDIKEYEKLENWVQRISHRLSLVIALARILLECHRDGNKKSGDIEALLILLNTYAKLTRTKLNHLELYLMNKN